MAVAISAIVAAGAAIGTEAFVGLALTAVADTGLALSVVGAVTGSKDLMKAGAVMGIAGGVGGAINGMFGAADAAASGSLADEGLATQADSVNALDKAANYNGLDSSLSSTASDTAATLPSATETGAQIGGNPTLTGAGGNIDPSTGLPTTGGSGATSTAMTPSGTPTSTPASTSPVSATPGIPDNTVQGNSINALDQGQNYSGIVNGTRSSSIIDGIKDLWGGLSKDQQALVLRGALAIPGSIQTQQNKARELALQAAKVQQTSYGSAVPSYSLPSTGIVNSVAKG